MSISLTWRQVNAWRIAQQHLSQRLPRPALTRAAADTGGIQAQVLSAAELALGARVEGLSPRAVQAALWQERSLVKTWGMRGTLHLLAAEELGLFAAARGALNREEWVRYFTYYGVSPEIMDAYFSVAPELLGPEPLTREQFAAAVLKETASQELYNVVIDRSWGTPLKPLAWRGELCFGPSRGQNVTFVNARKWLGVEAWQPLEPDQALAEIARRYLRVYGPANPENFAHWWGGGSFVRKARKIFNLLAEELARVEVGGWSAYALRSSLADIQNTEARGSVNLLPLFDAYVLGLGRHEELEPHLPTALHAAVFRPQGWISAVVLVDGVIAGLWEHKLARGQAALKIRLFSAPTLEVQRGIEAEAQRLSLYWNLPCFPELVS